MNPAQIARVCHEANRAIQIITRDPAVSPPWDDAPDWQRDSAINGVESARTGARPARMHELWCEEKRADGWTYGEVKDAEAKTHPCLVKYHELPEEQKAKDQLFVAIVRALSNV